MGHPLSEAFVSQRLGRFCSSLPLLEWIEADEGLSTDEKGQLVFDMGEILLRGPLEDRHERSRELCDWALERYPTAPACGSARPWDRCGWTTA